MKQAATPGTIRIETATRLGLQEVVNNNSLGGVDGPSRGKRFRSDISYYPDLAKIAAKRTRKYLALLPLRKLLKG